MKQVVKEAFQTIIDTFGSEKTIKVVFGAVTGFVIGATVVVFVEPNKPIETTNDIYEGED